MPNSGKTTRTIVWALCALFTVTLAAVVALYALTPGEGVAGLVGTLLANVSALAAVIVNLQRTGQVDDKVTRVVQDTHDLKNGLLDAKVRAGVAEVIHPDLVDPAYSVTEAAEDVATRQAGRDNNGTRPA